MGSNLTVGTETERERERVRVRVAGVFHFSKYGIRVGFGFINDGKRTDGEISKILVRVRVLAISETRSTVRICIRVRTSEYGTLIIPTTEIHG